MTGIRLYLDAIDPKLWPLALALAAWALVYAWRKAAPRLPSALQFDSLPARVQALPGVLWAAALSASTGADAVEAMRAALLGTLSGVLAIGIHHGLKLAPGPYGEKPTPEVKP